MLRHHLVPAVARISSLGSVVSLSKPADQLFVFSKLASSLGVLVDLAVFHSAGQESSHYGAAAAESDTDDLARDSAASRSCGIAALEHLASVEAVERSEVVEVAFLLNRQSLSFIRLNPYG